MQQKLWIYLAIAVAVLIGVAIWKVPELSTDQTPNPEHIAGEPIQAPPPMGDGPEIHIYTAASVASLLAEIAQLYERDTPVDIVVVPAASSVLARQIVEGAPAQIFISANVEWAQYLLDRGEATEEDRHILMTNRLALVAPKSGPFGPDENLSDTTKPNINTTLSEKISHILGQGRLAVCETRNVPCGQYAKQTLKSLKLWNTARHNLTVGTNAQSTLAWVERGEVPGGLIYMTEAMASQKVNIISFIPDGFHDPIIYEALVIDTADEDKDNAARAFIDFLQSTVVQRLLIDAGFIPAEIIDVKMQPEQPPAIEATP